MGIKTPVVTVCHCLRIVPISEITAFGIHGVRAYMAVKSNFYNLPLHEGPVKVSSSADGALIKKKITFEKSGLTPEGMEYLENLKKSRVVAVYIDEGCNPKICGSPSWPLTLDYTPEDGVYAVTLEGSDTKTDLFVRL